jgi:hypothetical protein
VDQITAAIDELGVTVMSKDGVGESITHLTATVSAANETFSRRKDVLTRTANI